MERMATGYGSPTAPSSSSSSSSSSSNSEESDGRRLARARALRALDGMSSGSGSGRGLLDAKKAIRLNPAEVGDYSNTHIDVLP